MLVKELQYDVKTKAMREVEVEIDFPNPRISEITNRIQEILQELKENDYKTIKYVEGDLTEEEFELHVARKQVLRDENDALEEELEVING